MRPTLPASTRSRGFSEVASDANTTRARSSSTTKRGVATRSGAPWLPVTSSSPDSRVSVRSAGWRKKPFQGLAALDERLF